MAVRARALTATDEAEWALFARRISPLPGRRSVAPPDVPSPDPVAPSPATPYPGAPYPGTPFWRAVAEAVSGRPPRRSPLDVGGQPPGVDTATWQRFQRGKLGGARKLDLHGMTAQHAFAALRAFLRAAHADRVRHVEIVTGQGTGEAGGVLRRELPLWLNLPDIRPMVLAAAHPYSSGAMHAHAANSGSVRLLLRRPRA